MHVRKEKFMPSQEGFAKGLATVDYRGVDNGIKETMIPKAT